MPVLKVVYAGDSLMPPEQTEFVGTNQPVRRRRLILEELDKAEGGAPKVQKVEVTSPLESLELAAVVHSKRYLEFLETAHARLVELGENADPDILHGEGARSGVGMVAIPAHSTSLCPLTSRPGKALGGQLGFYAQDRFTPIGKDTAITLRADLAVAMRVVELVLNEGETSVYCLQTHPGHHAYVESYGGYCYINQAAVVAKSLIANGSKFNKAAVIDVDYHCGNGTASIFYEDPAVFVASLHMDTEIDYPYSTGFADQIGSGAGEGTTLHKPLPAKADWKIYREAFIEVLAKVKEFGADVVVVSLGLDTLRGDPESVPEGGMQLDVPGDYTEMGELLRSTNVPIVYVSEGGYVLDQVPGVAQAAKCVVLGTTQGNSGYQ